MLFGESIGCIFNVFNIFCSFSLQFILNFYSLSLILIPFDYLLSVPIQNYRRIILLVASRTSKSCSKCISDRTWNILESAYCKEFNELRIVLCSTSWNNRNISSIVDEEFWLRCFTLIARYF